MCRIVLIASQKQIGNNLAEKLFSHFVRMSKDLTMTHELNKDKEGTFTHGDGWGVAYRDEQNHITINRSIEPIWKEEPEKWIEILSKSTAFMLHSRKASPGLAVSEEYVHPFTTTANDGTKIVMIHNGTVRKQDLIQFDPSFNPTSGSDSERVLYAFASKYNQLANEYSSSEIMHQLLDELPLESSANLVFMLPDKIMLTSNYYRFQNYLTMHYSITDDSIVIASEPIVDKNEWNSIPNHSYFEIDYVSPTNPLMVAMNLDWIGKNQGKL